MMAASACLWYLSFDISTYAYAYSRDIILKMMRIALLHLAPIPGDLTQNRQLLERASPRLLRRALRRFSRRN